MKKPSTSVTAMTPAITARGRPTTAVTYRRSISEHRLQERLAELAARREAAAQHHPPPLGAGLAAIDEHLPRRRHHHAADRVGRDAVDQAVALLIAAILERAEPHRQRVAHPLLHGAGDEARLARLFEVVLHHPDPAVEGDVALE